MGLIGDLVKDGGSRVTATSSLNLHGVKSGTARPSGPRARNGVGGVSRLVRIAGTWKNTGVGLRRLSPTRNSGGTMGHVNENPTSNRNGATNGNRGNRGTHTNENVHPKFRNNRVPLREHVPGEKFGGVFTGRVTTIGMSTLSGTFRSNTIISMGTLVRGNLIGGTLSNIGVLKGNRVDGGLAIGIGTCSSSTGRGVRTTNKGTRIVWKYLGQSWAHKELQVFTGEYSLQRLSSLCLSSIPHFPSHLSVSTISSSLVEARAAL